MAIVNKKVEHVKFGCGIITEANDHKIWVQFQNEAAELEDKKLKLENKKKKSTAKSTKIKS